MLDTVHLKVSRRRSRRSAGTGPLKVLRIISLHPVAWPATTTFRAALLRTAPSPSVSTTSNTRRGTRTKATSLSRSLRKEKLACQPDDLRSATPARRSTLRVNKVAVRQAGQGAAKRLAPFSRRAYGLSTICRRGRFRRSTRWRRSKQQGRASEATSSSDRIRITSISSMATMLRTVEANLSRARPAPRPALSAVRETKLSRCLTARLKRKANKPASLRLRVAEVSRRTLLRSTTRRARDKGAKAASTASSVKARRLLQAARRREEVEVRC